MKVAISSSSFAQALAARDLTQLEWLERCAATLGADGVVFDRAHFPRTDVEYLAQLKKVTVDLGLVPVGIDDPTLFVAPASDGPATAELASALGALFVLTVLPAPGAVPPATFVAAVGMAKDAVRAAKAVNITLLASVAAGTLGADVADLRHFVKDVDSAWLRYALPAGVDRRALSRRDRALVVTVERDADVEAIEEVTDDARPWILLRGDVDAPRVGALRCAAATKTLATPIVS
jgi:hypothetical protein